MANYARSFIQITKVSILYYRKVHIPAFNQLYVALSRVISAQQLVLSYFSQQNFYNADIVYPEVSQIVKPIDNNKYRYTLLVLCIIFYLSIKLSIW